MISKIIQDQAFKDQPPVFVDIGAAGGPPASFRQLAPYSILVAFDPDTRDFASSLGKSLFKKEIRFPRIVFTSNGWHDFYLTRNPHCSSTLRPNQETLKQWAFSPLFAVGKKVCLETMTLATALSQAGLTYVDYFKTDSQGLDLSLFQSLPHSILKSLMVAELEPGILESYVGEDRFADLLKVLLEAGFWPVKMKALGPFRLSTTMQHTRFNTFNAFFSPYLQKRAPFWMELRFLNSFFPLQGFSRRDLLLGCAFAIQFEQFGFALEISTEAEKIYPGDLFAEITTHCIDKLTLINFRKPLVSVSNLFRLLWKFFINRMRIEEYG